MRCPGCGHPIIEEPLLLGQQVACPQCGVVFLLGDRPAVRSATVVRSRRRSRNNPWQGVLLAVGCLAMVVVVAAIAMQPPPGAGERPAPASPELQQQRAELIATLRAQGVIHKIDTPGTVPRVYVLPEFYLLTFDDKQSLLSVCYAWVYELPRDPRGFNEPMWVYDARNNKKVGSFNAAGLELD